jgi:phytanoyl-CoA hydroxylase
MSASSNPAFDPGSDLHPAELYHPSTTGFGVDRFEDIGEREIAFYREQGYLLVRQAFTPTEVADALQGLLDLVAGRRPDFKEIVFEAQAHELLPTLTLDQRQDAVRKLWHFVAFEPRLDAIAHHPAMLRAIKALLGNRAPHMFQDMALIKPPRLGREKPWHQDKAYFDYPLDTPVVGVWIALDEATIENGCMQLLPRRHREGPIVHFNRRDWQICDDQVLGTASVAAPLPPGGLLFFDGLLPHGTPHNASPRRRRALQFHYAPADVIRAPAEERLRHFGSEGKNVTC